MELYPRVLIVLGIPGYSRSRKVIPVLGRLFPGWDSCVLSLGDYLGFEPVSARFCTVLTVIPAPFPVRKALLRALRSSFLSKLAERRTSVWMDFRHPSE